MTDTEKYTIEATETSLTILEHLASSEEPVGVTDLSEAIGIAKSAVHNHLKTLRNRGYIIKTGSKYEPSLRTLKLGNEIRNRSPVFELAKARIDNLAEATGETAAVFIVEENRGVPMYVAGSRNGWTPEFTEGDRVPLHTNASGKALLATFSDDDLSAVLESGSLASLTDYTITDADDLREQIARIRDSGHVFCKEEHYPGIVDVAAPIRPSGAIPSASVGVWAPTARLTDRYLEEDLVGQVLSTTRRIQAELANK